MRVILHFHKIDIWFIQDFCKIPVGFPMIVRRLSNVFLWFVFKRLSYDIPMFSNEFPMFFLIWRRFFWMIVRRFSDGPHDCLMFSYEFTMFAPWFSMIVSYGLPMMCFRFLCGFPLIHISTRTLRPTDWGQQIRARELTSNSMIYVGFPRDSHGIPARLL